MSKHINDLQRDTLEWLDRVSEAWREVPRGASHSPFIALCRRGFAKRRGGVGRPCIRLPVEYSITPAGRQALIASVSGAPKP